MKDIDGSGLSEAIKLLEHLKAPPRYWIMVGDDEWVEMLPQNTPVEPPLPSGASETEKTGGSDP